MSARILVVDDILPNVKLLEAKLTAQYYDVITAFNGEEAIAKAEADSPDLILLDIMMPGIDGFETCRRLKANKKTAHIPVVMVTALTDATDRVRGLESGADDFLSKPVNDTALFSRARSLLRLKMTIDEWRVRESAASTLGMDATSEISALEDKKGSQILIVEDRNYEADKYVETMQRDHHKTYIANGGMAAMEHLMSTEFDLIIVSLNLANEDGLRFCSHLRSNERTRAVPVIMVGNEEDMPRIAQGLDMGLQDYIIRPVDRNELLARCRAQMRRRRYQELLRKNYEQSLSMALIDPLTGLYNRRYVTVHLEKLLQKNAFTRKTLAVLMFDIDHFKKINDTYGHATGDAVLKIFAERISQGLRPIDMVARLGGEEFTVILPDIDLRQAEIVAERLRAFVAETPFDVPGPDGGLNVTVSIGAALINAEVITPELAIDRADKPLYEAKTGGRNRVVFEASAREQA
jgi:two-component system cell cycle response regulator